ILESRGNKDLVDSTGKNIGSKLASSTLHWGPSATMNKYAKTHYEQTSYEGFDQDWHLYQMEWTPKNITFKIDNESIGTVTPPDAG
uniref:family 16 glycosylhydrolase n=1 Tax=Natrialba sp. PRR66 TaxID=3098146 RepID=UPI002B1CE7FD